MNLLENYEKLYPTFRSRIELFDEATQRKVLKSLRKEKDELNFRSLLSEIEFGLGFVNSGIRSHYEKKYNNLTPDWTMQVNSQTIICEIVRLNPVQKDINRNEFDSKIRSLINEIEGNWYLEVNFKNQYFDVGKYDLDKIIKELKPWLTEDRSIGDKITIQDNFMFLIIGSNPKVNIIQPIGNFNDIYIDKTRLTSENSGFGKKIEKYSSIIKNYKFPYIIGLDLDLYTGIDDEDISTILYGPTVDFIKDKKSFSQYTCFKEGLFYQNEFANRYLSGVLLRVNNNFNFNINYSKFNLLSKENKLLFYRIKNAATNA